MRRGARATVRGQQCKNGRFEGFASTGAKYVANLAAILGIEKGSGQAAVPSLQNRLFELGFVSNYREYGVDVLRTIGKTDVLLAVSVNRYVSHTIEAAKFAKARGTRVVALTDSEISPLASIADEVIVVRTETPSFFHTMAPAFAAVECLAALVAARRGPETLAALDESERQLAAFGTYLLPRSKERRK